MLFGRKSKAREREPVKPLLREDPAELDDSVLDNVAGGFATTNHYDAAIQSALRSTSCPLCGKTALSLGSVNMIGTSIVAITPCTGCRETPSFIYNTASGMLTYNGVWM